LKFYNQKKGGIIIKKLDSVTRQPLEGVEFQLTYSDGCYVDDNYGHTSSQGLYRTNRNGEIRIFGITGTIVVQETETIPGYVLNKHSQTVKVNADDVQTITFYNTPLGGVELIKVDAADKSRRLSGAVFEIRKMNDALVDTVTTGKNGRVYADLDAGSYYALEVEAPKGYKLDKTPHYFKVKNGETTSVTITNKALSGILIHKTDSATGKALQGVTFLLYTYQLNLDHWIYPTLGDLKMPDITPANITALLLNMQSQGKAHASVIKIYTILSSLFKMAYLGDAVPVNPMDKVERPKPRKDEVKDKSVEAYTPEQIQQIITAVQTEPLKWQCYFRVLIDTGIRRGEASAIRWENVNFKENTITIAGNLCYTPDKGT